jgi:hypothetical protein
MVAEKRFSKQSFAEDREEMMMSGVSYRGMHIIFFDEKQETGSVEISNGIDILHDRMSWYCKR